jgi:hypothetical protein
VFGWRLIALLDLRTLNPLAIKIVPIQAHEAPHLAAAVATRESRQSDRLRRPSVWYLPRQRTAFFSSDKTNTRPNRFAFM